MASQPPNTPPPYPPQYVYVDPRAARQAARAQAAAARAQFQMARAQRRAMRRRSILGPVLLLAIGVVFLLETTRMVDSHTLFLWYSQWWPVLLIAGGAILLLEWALDTRAVANGTPRGTRVGGGAVWLIVLLVFVGMSASSTRDWNWNWFHPNFNGDDDWSAMFMGPQHQADQQVSQDIPAGAMVSVENQRGDITIASATAPGNTLQISMHKTIYGDSSNQAQSRLDEFKPVITTNGNTVIVRVDGGNNASADLVITLPAKTQIDLHAHHGDISVTGQQADVTLASDHGDVRADTITGNVRGKLDHGDFVAHGIQGDVGINGRHFGDVTVSDVSGKVTLEGEFYGDTHVEHIAGAFHFHSSRTDFAVAKLDGSFTLDSGELSAEEAVGPTKLTTRSKDITLNRVTGDVTVENSNGGVDIDSALPLGAYDIRNRNGHIKVTVPANANFIVDAEATQGDLQSDFALTRSGSDNNGNLSGTVGSGGPRLALKADHGDLELRRSSNAVLRIPEPPAVPLVPHIPKPPKIKAVAPVPAPPAEPTQPE